LNNLNIISTVREDNEQYQKVVQIVEDFNSKQSFTLQSSGSTGSPKELHFTRAQLIKSAKRTLEFFKLNSKSIIWLALNPEYVAGYMMVIRAIEANCSLVISQSSEPFSDALKGVKSIDFVSLVPLQVKSILKNEPELFDRIKNVLIGGAAIDPKLENGLLNANTKCRFYHSYATTETLTHVALRKLGSPWFEAIGNNSFEQNSDSCLVIGSEIAGRLETTDIVELASSRKFKWLGRKDFIINSGGIKIQPEKLESILSDFLKEKYGIAQFIISSIPDEKLGEKCILVLKETNNLDQNKLLSDLKEISPEYWNPKKILDIGKRPLFSERGKALRKEIREELQNL